MGIQILRVMTAATIVALDLDEEPDLVEEIAAHHAFFSDVEAAYRVKEPTGGRRAQAVFDFVAIQPTSELGPAMVRVGGDQVLAGVGSSTLPLVMLERPWKLPVRAPYGEHRSELFGVLELVRTGAIHVETEVFPLDDAPKACEELHAGALRGRAVIVPCAGLVTANRRGPGCARPKTRTRARRHLPGHGAETVLLLFVVWISRLGALVQYLPRIRRVLCSQMRMSAT